MVGEILRDRISAWVKSAAGDATGVVEMVTHRVTHGSPPLLSPSEDLALSARATLDAKQERIRRRRMLLGLPFEEWRGPGGKG